jgi:hypothetical protein
MILLRILRRDLWQRVIPKIGERLFRYLFTCFPSNGHTWLLFLAASHGLIVHQMNVKTAFLNGELKEQIYID